MLDWIDGLPFRPMASFDALQEQIQFPAQGVYPAVKIIVKLRIVQGPGFKKSLEMVGGFI
jgi:hypothetical protein